MSDIIAAAKLALVGKVFHAATLLYTAGLQTEKPEDTLRRYVAMNPDMADFVSRNPDGRLPNSAEGEYK